MITDRIVLDQQLQDTIYQFEHKRGVVRRIDHSSRQLAEALDSGVPIIVTTLQKFPFVSRHLLEMAEERGTAGTGTLPPRRFAVIVDEAHSSQGGEAATDLKEVLGGEALRQSARTRAAEEGRADLEELFRSMAKRGRQANLSFFAFTATPKHKTLAVFGRDGSPVHRYTMRQAIQEGFILDVLEHYTTYETYFRLLKACDEDPHVERKTAARALARFMRLHPHNIAQKTEVMVEHFQAVTRHRIGGRAKAMVVTGSRLEAVRYKQSFDRYIQRKGYAIKSLVAFSGEVEDEAFPGVTHTEPGMNQGISEKELPERFATAEYQVLLVAEKYQTGFDQPLLHTMFVDKRLAGIQAVQTLSRLNRVHPRKEDTFVRFMNDGAFRNVVTEWMSSEAYHRLRMQTGARARLEREALPPVLRVVEPAPKDRYVSCVPLVPLEAAAGAFSDTQRIDDADFEWVAVASRHRLRRGMFVARVVGESMEPAIPDGAYCLFRSPVEGTRQGRTVLVEMRDTADPESGQRYTVKRYRSEKVAAGDSWHHSKITLSPVNPDFEPIVLAGADEGQLRVVAEVLEVLGDGA